jgi:hypothetical protein
MNTLPDEMVELIISHLNVLDTLVSSKYFRGENFRRNHLHRKRTMIPDELLREVISYLGVIDTFKSRRVSKQWDGVVKHLRGQLVESKECSFLDAFYTKGHFAWHDVRYEYEHFKGRRLCVRCGDRNEDPNNKLVIDRAVTKMEISGTMTTTIITIVSGHLQRSNIYSDHGIPIEWPMEGNFQGEEKNFRFLHNIFN